MAAETDVSERQVRLALAYREHYSWEIDEAITDNRRPLDELQQLYPFITLADAG